MLYKISTESDLIVVLGQMRDEQTAIVRYYSDIIFTLQKGNAGVWVMKTNMMNRLLSYDDMFWTTVRGYLQLTSNNLTCEVLDSYEEMAFHIRQQIIKYSTKPGYKDQRELEPIRNDFEEHKGKHVKLSETKGGYLVGLSSSDEDYYWVIYDEENDKLQFHSCVTGLQEGGKRTCEDALFDVIHKKLYEYFNDKRCLEVLIASI